MFDSMALKYINIVSLFTLIFNISWVHRGVFISQYIILQLFALIWKPFSP